MSGVNRGRSEPPAGPRTWVGKGDLLLFVDHAAPVLCGTPGAYLTLVAIGEHRTERTVARLDGRNEAREVQRWLARSAPAAAGGADEARFRLRLWRARGEPAGSRSFRLRGPGHGRGQEVGQRAGGTRGDEQLRRRLEGLADGLRGELGNIRTDFGRLKGGLEAQEVELESVREGIRTLQEQINDLAQVVFGVLRLVDEA